MGANFQKNWKGCGFFLVDLTWNDPSGAQDKQSSNYAVGQQ